MNIDSLYRDYVKERAGLEMISDENSFVTYKITGEEIFIADMFISKSHRGHKKFKNMIETLSSIGKQSGCKVLSGNIALSDPGASHTMRAVLRVGFKIGDANSRAILVVKNLEER